MFQRITVPLDGSELAERALPTAKELATLYSAPIHLLRVIDFTRLESFGPYGLGMEYTSVEPIVASEEAAAAAYLADMEVSLTEQGFTVTTELRRGVVVREVIDAMKPDDLTVMASHGRGGVSRWLLGSVAEEVIRHAPAPVLLVPARAQS